MRIEPRIGSCDQQFSWSEKQTAMKPTVAGLKSMTENADCIKVVNALFEAIAYEQTVKALIEPKQQEVVDFFKFEIKPELVERYTEMGAEFSPIITRYDDIYEASDEDCNLFYKEMHRIHLELGFKVKMNHCPILIAERMTRDVKIEVADFLEPHIGISYDMISRRLDTYKQYYDLIMTMFAQSVKEYQKTNAIKI